MKLLFKQLLCALQQGSKCPAQWVTMMIEILPLKNSTSLGFNLLYLIYCRKNLLYRNEVKRGNDALIEGNDIHEVQKKKQRWTCYHSIETKILRRLYLVWARELIIKMTSEVALCCYLWWCLCKLQLHLISLRCGVMTALGKASAGKKEQPSSRNFSKEWLGAVGVA